MGALSPETQQQLVNLVDEGVRTVIAMLGVWIAMCLQKARRDVRAAHQKIRAITERDGSIHTTTGGATSPVVSTLLADGARVETDVVEVVVRFRAPPRAAEAPRSEPAQPTGGEGQDEGEKEAGAA